MNHETGGKPKKKKDRVSLHPLSVKDIAEALLGTGPMPEELKPGFKKQKRKQKK